jgi:ABC-2 type transport system permease protein
MGNVLNIARKEFADFMGSKFIIIVTLVFLVTIGINLYFISANYTHNNSSAPLLGYSQYYVHSGLSTPALLSILQDSLCRILLSFGSIIALLMGYLAISNERRNNALTTIITKPLFRDTIINGKLLGAVAFLVVFFVFISAIYTFGMIVIVGDAINSITYDYLASIPLMVALALICVMIYYSFSLLVSIIFKNDILALFVSVLIWIILNFELDTWDISMYIAAFFGQSQLAIMDVIIKLCPNNLIIFPIVNNNDNFNIGFVSSVLANGGNVIVLCIYLFIIVVVSYTVFLRRDIS